MFPTAKDAKNIESWKMDASSVRRKPLIPNDTHSFRSTDLLFLNSIFRFSIKSGRICRSVSFFIRFQSSQFSETSFNNSEIDTAGCYVVSGLRRVENVSIRFFLNLSFGQDWLINLQSTEETKWSNINRKCRNIVIWIPGVAPPVSTASFLHIFSDLSAEMERGSKKIMSTSQLTCQVSLTTIQNQVRRIVAAQSKRHLLIENRSAVFREQFREIRSWSLPGALFIEICHFVTTELATCRLPPIIVCFGDGTTPTAENSYPKLRVWASTIG